MSAFQAADIVQACLLGIRTVIGEYRSLSHYYLICCLPLRIGPGYFCEDPTMGLLCAFKVELNAVFTVFGILHAREQAHNAAD
jgi:hypothetical protein